MSSVLRPVYYVKKNIEEVADEISKQTTPVEVSAKPPDVVLPTSKEIHQTPEVVSDVASHEPVENSLVAAVAEENAKEAKISAVLQEILDRKIDKAIIGAEASLDISTPVAAPPVLTPEVVPQPQAAPVEIVKTTGQEIHIPVAEVVPPVSKIISPQETVTTSAPTNINVIPVHIASQEVVPPVTANTTPTTNPQVVVDIAPQAPKIHWFDKLFGSVPKTPPQSV